MDILKLGDFLDQNGMVEDLMFEAARKALVGWNSRIEEAYEEARQFAAKARNIQESMSADINERIRSAAHDRDHWLELFGALINSDYDGNGDYLFNWSAADRVRAKRREIDELFSGRERPDEPEPEVLAPPPSPKRVVDFAHRPGRRSKYAMPDFFAEMMRRCMSGPVHNQEELVRHMAEWCSENWGAEPSSSTIHDWVAPAFRAVQALRA